MSAAWGEGPARVAVNAAGALLEGERAVPAGARAVVVFPHGSGLGRGPGHAFVARKLHEAGLATLLVDLLTAEERQLDARVACFRFDVSLLAGRLTGVVSWLADDLATRELPAGCFASGSSAAAALVAASVHPAAVAAVVAHEGRPDLAEHALPHVEAATLLLVEGGDEPLVGLNRTRYEQLGAREKRFVLVPGAASLDEAANDWEEVARLALEWFDVYLDLPTRGEPKPRQAGRPAHPERPGAEPRRLTAEHGG
jgi:dienelactone hydrolase